MKVIDGAQFWLSPRLAQCHGACQPRQQLGEAKPAVKTVGGLGQIAPRVLGLSHGVVAAADGTFDVAEQDVYPARVLDLGGGAPPSVSKAVRLSSLDGRLSVVANQDPR